MSDNLLRRTVITAVTTAAGVSLFGAPQSLAQTSNQELVNLSGSISRSPGGDNGNGNGNGNGGKPGYPSCPLPEDGSTGEQNGELHPDYGCVPNGCIDSNFVPPKCDGYGPPDKPEPSECPEGTVAIHGICITPPEPCPADSRVGSDGECLPSEPLECPEGTVAIDGSCEQPPLCPEGQTPTEDGCEPEVPLPPEGCYGTSGSTVYVPEEQTCAVKAINGANSSAGYQTILIRRQATMDLRDSNLFLANETETITLINEIGRAHV